MSKTPIFTMLKDYHEKARISFSMPGHKGGRGLGERAGVFCLDVTELLDTDNLYTSAGAVAEARKMAAEFFGADETFFLTNGTTGGIYMMLAAVCRRGDKVLVNRGCHGAVMNACIMLGLQPIFAEHTILAGFSAQNSVTPAEIERCMQDDVRAILITSPNFYGVCADVAAIAEFAHAHGIPLLVDEAHGAHYAADPTIFPTPAIRCGADMVVQSAHKTLNAPNQTSYLHVRSDLVDKKRLGDCVQMLQTSSPSYVMAGFLDSARKELAGKNNWRMMYENCVEFKRALENDTKVKAISKATADAFSVDETRLVLNFSAYETTGFAVLETLRAQYNIDIEMADLYNIVCIVTAANTKEELDILFAAIREITAGLPMRKTPAVSQELPKVSIAMTPTAAFDARGEWVAVSDAIGRIAKGTTVVYPPGIPVLFPGAVISAATVEYLKVYQNAGGEIVGMDDDKLYVVK